MDGFSLNESPFDGSIAAAQGNLGGPTSGRGRMVVGAVVLLAVALGAFAVWFQWEQTRRCLGFMGPDVAAAIQSAPRVELWGLASEGTRICRTSVQDVSRAAGLVHLRRGLIEDVNYTWDADGASAGTGQSPLPRGVWDVAIVFISAGRGEGSAVILAIDLDAPGAMTVVGRPGRVTLGRIRPGLERWVKATRSAMISQEKSAY